jgi:YegS/Rv2252/BmrU family lipid kinase
MYYFIVNEMGGSGRSHELWKKIKNRLDDSGIDYSFYITKYKGHAEKIAGMVSEYDDDDISIIVVGGDGTINEVLNGISDFSRVKFGVIPTGSGNDFINGLGFDTDSDEALNRIIESTETRLIDIGQVQGDDLAPRCFGISCGIGMDAIVCKNADDSGLKKFLNKIHKGDLTYKLMTVITLFSMEYMKATVSFDGREKYFKKLIFLSGMNMPAEGGGVPMRPDADSSDGIISFLAADSIGRTNAFFKLPKLVAGKHNKARGFYFDSGSDIKIKTERPAVLHLDGEYYGDVSDVHIKCLNKVLKIIV